MSVLLDLAGTSTEDVLSGLLLHAVVIQPVTSVPASTKYDHAMVEFDRSEVVFHVIGKLESCDYLLNTHSISTDLENILVSELVPNELKSAMVKEFYTKLCTSRLPPCTRGNTYLIPLGQCVFNELVERNFGSYYWSSKVNCHQYCRLLIEFGLGLQWPSHVAVGGDLIPEILNVVMFYKACVLKWQEKNRIGNKSGE
ncbi:unnamed protein product [Didymodactylos carnosus]|nr:unnamed protein product [Didymodactylos carnosus]CAF3823305.1 unnamed protein product [Didymodactylos carnosus]